MRRRLLVLGGAIFLAIGGTIGEEIVNSSGQLCAAPAKASFAEDVMPIFVGRCFAGHPAIWTAPIPILCALRVSI